MARSLWTLLLPTLVSPAWSQQGTPDLVVNGSFEAVDEAGMPVGWSNWLKEFPEPNCISVDETIAHSGRRSLKISHRQPTSYSMMSQQVDFEPNRSYIITGWIKGDDIQPGAGAMLARLYIGKEGGGTFKVSRTFSDTFDWSFIEIGPFPVETRTWLTLIPYLHHSTGTVWFDDLTFHEVTKANLARMAQKRARDRAVDDLATVEAAATEFGAETLIPEVRALRERCQTADDLPTTIDARQGPPYFALHEDVFRLMARVNRAAWPGAVRAVYTRWADPYSDVAPLLETPPGKSRPHSIEMLNGESEPACLRLSNLTETVQAIEVSLTDAPSPEALTWRLLHYVPTDGGLIIGDPLPRVGSGSGPVEIDIPPGMTQDLWLMIDSSVTGPGRFRSRLQVTTPDGQAQTLRLSILIHPIDLPDELPIHTFAYAYTTWELLKGRIPQSRADLRAHRINTYVIHGAFTPWPTFSDAGEWRGLDWSGTDDQIALHPDAKCLLLWPGMEIGDRVNRLTPEGGAEYPSAEWRPYAERWAKELAEGMTERGFGYDDWALYIVDEPSAARARMARAVGEAVDAADRAIRIFENPYGAATPADMQLMGPVVDIWCPSLDTAEDDRLSFCRDTASEVWMYQVLGKTSSPLRAFRIAFWEAFAKDLRGFGFWDYADCGGSVWDPWDVDRHDYAVVYDGDGDELIPSKRWEAYREGAEDFAMLTMLAKCPGWDRQRAVDIARAVLEAGDAASLHAARETAIRALADAAEN